MNKQRIGIVVVGIVAVAGAWWYRHHVTATKQYRLQAALQDPRVKQMQAQIGRLQAAVAAHPNDVDARWRLADAYQKIRAIDLAAEQIQAIVKLQPDSKDAALALGNVRLAVGQIKEAEDTYRGMTTRWPKLAEAWEGLATALYHENRFMESMAAIRTAIRLEPNNPSNHFILADTLVQYVNQFPSTEPYVEYALRAKAEYEKILPVWPDEGDVHFRLGNACLLARDQQGAVDHYRKAIDLHPKRVDIYVQLAQVYITVANQTAARRVIDDALAHHLESAALYDLQGRLVQSSGERGSIEKALAAFKKATEMDPQNEGYQERYGSSLVRANRLPDARVAFEKAVLIDPDRAYPYQQLAAIYTRLGDSAHATAAAKMATEMVANDQLLRQIQLLSRAHPENIKLHLVLARRYKELRLLSAARDKYLLVLRMDPKNREAKDTIAALDAQGTAMMARTR